MTRDDLVYFAGFFDGEGSIIIHNRSSMANARGRTRAFRLLVTLTNTDHAIMLWTHRVFGGCLYEYAPVDDRAKAWKWTKSCKAAGEWLKQIYPYLRVKQKEAEVALRFQEHMEESKKHNHIKGIRGSVPITAQMIEHRNTLATELRHVRSLRLIR